MTSKSAVAGEEPARPGGLPVVPPLRVVIEQVRPAVNEGRFPIKRATGESVIVTAHIHADGHDRLAAILRYRHRPSASPREEGAEAAGWREIPMEPLGNDEWTAGFTVHELGTYEYTVAAGVDRGPRDAMTTGDRALRVVVDRGRARFGAWYEMFPRSAGPDPTRSATFAEAEGRLRDIAEMGFDVLYLPPIHPIGRRSRKGRNSAPEAGPNDPGSPWAIGSRDGGHKAVEPGLGTVDDFDRFVSAARRLGLEVALDLAYQCSPDHPYVTEHPEWFRRRADGTIRHAENPPKTYPDIHPFDFECREWRSLWQELKSIALFWIARGVKIFRVDNPHTKPYAFWEWLIGEVKAEHPDTIFLSEAFTRPKVMRYLAKLGFTQSYTYFTWRNTKEELTEYFTELTQTEVREYLRPNLFANTPDILHEYLQRGGRPAFEVRLILAATLGASYGIYNGFELCEARPLKPGSEEYLDSEKYQYRQWDWDRPGHIRELVALVNRIRRVNPALHADWSLRFCRTDNPQITFYMKATADRSNVILVVVNLDPHHMQHGWVQVPLAGLGLNATDPYEVQDLLDDSRYTWRGEWNYVRLDPEISPAHILRLNGKVTNVITFCDSLNV